MRANVARQGRRIRTSLSKRYRNARRNRPTPSGIERIRHRHDSVKAIRTPPGIRSVARRKPRAAVRRHLPGASFGRSCRQVLLSGHESDGTKGPASAFRFFLSIRVYESRFHGSQATALAVQLRGPDKGGKNRSPKRKFLPYYRDRTSGSTLRRTNHFSLAIRTTTASGMRTAAAPST